MLKKIAWRSFGLFLLIFCVGLWAWMLGWFARPLPPHTFDTAPMLKAWMAPGVMGFPAIVSVIAGVVGLLFVTGVLPLPPSEDNNSPVR